MKNSILTVTLITLFSTSAAYAHHPAEDRVDPDIYAMIDANVADTPHADLTFDDMGSTMESAVDAMEAAGTEAARGQMEGMMESVAEAVEAAGAEMGRGQMEAMMESRELNLEVAADMNDNVTGAIDTMGLMEAVVESLAE
jgi:hypothetical protein